MLRRRVGLVFFKVSRHFEHGVLDVRTVQIKRRAAHQNGTAAEIFHVKARLLKNTQILQNRRVLVFVHRHRHGHKQRLRHSSFFAAFELFVQQSLVRRVLVNKHQRLRVVFKDDIRVKHLADHLMRHAG